VSSRKSVSYFALIPRSRVRTTKVNAIKEKMKSFRAEGDLLLVGSRGRGPGKGADFEPLDQNAHAGAVKVECFEPVAAPIGEEEKGSVFETVRIEFVGESGKTIEGFTHVARLKGEKDAQVVGETHHARPPDCVRLTCLRRCSMS